MINWFRKIWGYYKLGGGGWYAFECYKCRKVVKQQFKPALKDVELLCEGGRHYCWIKRAHCMECARVGP